MQTIKLFMSDWDGRHDWLQTTTAEHDIVWSIWAGDRGELSCAHLNGVCQFHAKSHELNAVFLACLPDWERSPPLWIINSCRLSSDILCVCHGRRVKYQRRDDRSWLFKADQKTSAAVIKPASSPWKRIHSRPTPTFPVAAVANARNAQFKQYRRCNKTPAGQHRRRDECFINSSCIYRRTIDMCDVISRRTFCNCDDGALYCVFMRIGMCTHHSLDAGYRHALLHVVRENKSKRPMPPNPRKQ